MELIMFLHVQGFQMRRINHLEHCMALTTPLRADPGLTPNPLYLDQILNLPGSLELDSGIRLQSPRLAYRLLGAPDKPVICVLGGISASRFAWQPESAPLPGWWQAQIGPGRVLDTHHYRILTLDLLGGNGESESPRNSSWAGSEFPQISTRDQARALAGLLRVLGINQLESLIGASYGGMVALAFCELFPGLVGRSLVICAAHQAWPLATGWRHIQRELVRFGLRHDDVATGLKLARALAVTTYRSGVEFAQRFESGPGCTAYLEHCGERFSFDPYAYLCLSQSIDAHRVAPEDIDVPIDLIGFDSDQLVPPVQLEALHRALPQARALRLIETLYGHDAFLKEDALIAKNIKHHLESCQ
jgi:homoserine O-acetyltransferase